MRNGYSKHDKDFPMDIFGKKRNIFLEEYFRIRIVVKS